MQQFTAACPNCHRQTKIEVESDGTVPKNWTVVCEHCGVENRVSAFQKEYRWQVEAPERERKKAEAEKRKEEHRREQETARAEWERQETGIRATEARMYGPPTDFEGLALRLERVERQIRNRKIFEISAAIVFGVLALITVAGLIVSQAEMFVFNDEYGRALGGLGAFEDGSRGLAIYGKNGETIIWLGVHQDGSQGLYFGDENGKRRIWMGVQEDDSPVLTLHDGNEKLRAALGAVDIRSWFGLMTKKRPESSLTLFDEKEYAIWSAP